MATTVLTISSKNYGAWALRGWLMARLAKLEFTEKIISPDDPAMKAEMLLREGASSTSCAMAGSASTDAPAAMDPINARLLCPCVIRLPVLLIGSTT